MTNDLKMDELHTGREIPIIHKQPVDQSIIKGRHRKLHALPGFDNALNNSVCMHTVGVIKDVPGNDFPKTTKDIA